MSHGTHRRIRRAVGTLVIALLAVAPAAQAAAVTVLCSNGLRAVLTEVAPQFEQVTGHRLDIRYSVSAELKKRIDGGERFDVAILTPGLVKALADAGTLAADSLRAIARSGMAVSIRSGAPKPDLRNVETLKASVLAARSIAFANEGAGGLFFTSLVQRLGLAAQLEPKFKRLVTGQDVSRAVATGEAELGVQPLSEILNVPGVELAGTFPSEVQDYTVMMAGIATASPQRDAGQQLIAFLLSSALDPVVRTRGMERAPS